jgi:hypothetical protein
VAKKLESEEEFKQSATLQKKVRGDLRRGNWRFDGKRCHKKAVPSDGTA